MRASKLALTRVKHVLLSDKTSSNLDFLNVLKSDLLNLLKNYAEIDSVPDVKIEVGADGLYKITVAAVAKKIIGVKVV